MKESRIHDTKAVNPDRGLILDKNRQIAYNALLFLVTLYFIYVSEHYMKLNQCPKIQTNTRWMRYMIIIFFLGIAAFFVQTKGALWGVEATFGYGGGGGGSLYHRDCYQGTCQYILGFGIDKCDTNIECATNGNANGTTNQNTNGGAGNQNMNGQGGNQNMNTPGNQNGNGFFNDMGNHWASEYAQKMYEHCDITGYRDSLGNLLYQFRPDTYITRAELLIWGLKCRHIIAPTPTANPFPDVNRNTWYGPYVARAKALGWVSGYPDGLFRPLRYANRVEATKVLTLRNFPSAQIIGGIMDFLDTMQGSWYEKYVAFATLQGYIEGYRDLFGNLTGYFGPADNMTRAEAAKIIVQINGF